MPHAGLGRLLRQREQVAAFGRLPDAACRMFMLCSVGRRRLVVIESWRNYVARKLAAPPEDARRNNRVRPSARLRSKPLPAGEAAPVTRPESAWVANRLAPSAMSGREETAGPAQSVRRTALKVS